MLTVYPMINGLDAYTVSTGQCCLFVEKLFGSCNGKLYRIRTGKNIKKSYNFKFTLLGLLATCIS